MKSEIPLEIIVLVRGVLQNGSPHFAYVSVPSESYVAFKQAESEGEYDLRDYGTILVQGSGLNPSEEIVRWIETHYGANLEFEADLISSVTQSLFPEQKK